VAGRTESVWDERLPGTIGETAAEARRRRPAEAGESSTGRAESGLAAAARHATERVSQAPEPLSTSARSHPGCPVTGLTRIAAAACCPAAYDLQNHGVAVNALSPSKPIITPGLSYYAREYVAVSTPDEFARAAAELALVDPAVVTGRTIGHLQVLDGSFRALSS
jgi:hypothetical protein